MIINDEYIKSIFKPIGHKYIIKKCARAKIINSNNDIKDYLINRFENINNFDEILYLILNNYKSPPTCIICGNRLIFKNITYGYVGLTCSKKCHHKFIKQTNMQKYGVDNPAKSDIIKQKIKNTNIQRYGYTNPMKNNIIKQKVSNILLNISDEQRKNINNKIKNTLLQRYGVTNNLHIPNVEEKIKQKNIQKYGVKYCLQSSKVREKIKKTSLLKYGVDNPAKSEIIKQKQSITMSSFEVQNKINNTKKKLKSFNSSKIEKQFKEYLEQKFPNDFECQYRSELYPFNCDFYIKSLNLYIEIQGSWVHGGHPFNENDEKDIKRLNDMKQKNTKFYIIAIDVWTNRDVNKRNIAKENNLNYLEIFSCNINECIRQFNNFLL